VTADLDGAAFEGLNLAQILEARMLLNVQLELGLLVVLSKFGERERLGPWRHVEHFGGRADGDVRIHQRRAAETGAFDDSDVVVVDQLVET
jgi:hypothetical protein